MLDIVFNNLSPNKKYKSVFFEKILEESVKITGLKFDTIEVSVNLVSEAQIKELNKKYRDKDMPTDVLSFPINEQLDAKSAVNGIISLGDIFICLPIAEKYALQEGISLDLKLSFLTVHGFLHLLGYDHEKNQNEEIKMFTLQDKILKSIKVHV